MSTSFCIASGKGGVGKSTFTANLGAVLAHRGSSVMIVDMDIGLRSQDALLSLENQIVYDLVDVSANECDLDQAILAHPTIPNLSLLPAAQFARAKALQPARLKQILEKLKASYEYIFLDAPAGIERGLRNALNAGVDQTILIVTPDDICIRDAERTAQIITQKNLPRPRIVVNRLDYKLIRAGEMYPARTVADVLDLELLGELPEDQVVSRSILNHRLFVDYDCEARSAMLRIASRVSGEEVPLPAYGTHRISLWRRLFPTNMD